MSAISEVDIRDWDKVDFTLLEKADKVSPHDLTMLYFEQFFKEVQALRDKQLKAVQRKIPRLLQASVDAVNRGE